MNDYGRVALFMVGALVFWFVGLAVVYTAVRWQDWLHRKSRWR